MRDGGAHPTENDGAGPTDLASIDDLLDRAVAALNRGDRVTGAALAQQVLAADGVNADAEELLAAPADRGEIRRLTMFFVDLVDSTALSTQVEPETYGMLVGHYRDQVHTTVKRFGGHVSRQQGDGLLAVFGHPVAHEDDVRRAVLAALEINSEVARLAVRAQRQFGVGLSVRVGVHRGVVYLNVAHDDVYGLAANVAARVCALASPGTVVVSDAVELLVRKHFEVRGLPAAAVKGVEEPIVHHQVIGERAEPVRAGRGPLVGRDREVAAVQAAWGHAQAGTLSVPGVVLRGEAGIGKSRLAAVAVDLAEHSGAVVLELVGSPFHTDAGLHPVRTLLERRCGIGRLTDPAERLRLLDAEVRAQSLDPEPMLPLLAPVLGIAATAGYEPVPVEGRKLYALIVDAVQTYLRACLRGGTGLVIAEDVHWFDPSTMEVLTALHDAPGGGLLIAMTGRPGDWLPVAWPVTVHDLTPLTDGQVDALITALNPELTTQERAAVGRRCDGVPFYIEQVVGGLSDSGVPDALYEPLFARLRARAHVVPVLEAAAVIGRQLDHGLLCTVVDLSKDEVDAVIAELEEALVFEPWGVDSWRFRHELLREVAADLAPPSVRRVLHATVADALVAGGDPDWTMVAAHYGKADRFEAAVSAYQRASATARNRGALSEARTYLSFALEQLDRTTPSPARDRQEMVVRLERGFLASAADGPQNRETAADFERCLQLGGTDLRDDELFASLTALTSYYAGHADLTRMAQVVESLHVNIKGRQWFRPVIDYGFGVVAFLRGEFETARLHVEAASAGRVPADQHQINTLWFQPTDPVTASHLFLAMTRGMCGDLSGAERELDQASWWAAQLGYPRGPFMDAYTRTVDILLHTMAGQLDRCAVLADDVIELAERHGFGIWQLTGASLQVCVAALATATAEDIDVTALAAHIATVTTLVDTSRSYGLLIYITYYDATLGQLLLAAGHPEQARERLEIGLRTAADTGMHYYDAELLRLRAQTHTDPDAREADLVAGHALARRQGATLFELRSALDLFELRGADARAALADAVGRMPADAGWPELARARAALGQSAG